MWGGRSVEKTADIFFFCWWFGNLMPRDGRGFVDVICKKLFATSYRSATQYSGPSPPRISYASTLSTSIDRASCDAFDIAVMRSLFQLLRVIIAEF